LNLLLVLRELRQAAAAQGRAELLALFAGQASPLGRDVSAETLVAEVVAQAQGLLGRSWA
jgi:hypothetical protein